ncbi:MAG: GGDEF domain-containing protein [Acidobacteria bacterium]|nr:GGDEF domain-containing protein [Acidobacteriota bacterium]
MVRVQGLLEAISSLIDHADAQVSRSRVDRNSVFSGRSCLRTAKLFLFTRLAAEKNEWRPRFGRPAGGWMKARAPGPRRRSLNLAKAQRILQHAGKSDLLRAGADPEEQVQRLIDALCDLSIHDGLTGLVNATFFHAALAAEIDRSARTGRTCGLLVIDLDHFKNLNDTHGHQAGDRALQVAASIMRKTVRKMDTAARIGGEEFAVMLLECTPEASVLAAARIHGALNPFQVNLEGLTVTLTSSAGLVWTDPTRCESARQLLARADRELYRAKRSGRRQLCHPPVPSTEVTAHEKVVLMGLASGEVADER